MNEASPSNRDQLARKYVIEDPRSGNVPLLERKWYYTIEIEPGRFTPGLEFENIHLTREALGRVEVRGLDCLDIGTMEGIVPILLSRRQARRVVAYDRLDFGDRIRFLQEKLRVDFNYLAGLAFSDLPARLRAAELPALYDLVVFSGVLYHMLDPLGGLLGARRLVRNGGVLVVETAAVRSAEDCLYLNSKGRFFGGDNFWLPSLSCLEYMLRFARLRPLDCFHLPLSGAGPHVSRVCVPCLAVEQALAEPGDEWIRLPQAYDFREHLSWSALQEAARPVLDYGPVASRVAERAPGCLDLFESVQRTNPSNVTDPKEQVWLRLDALH